MLSAYLKVILETLLCGQLICFFLNSTSTELVEKVQSERIYFDSK